MISMMTALLTFSTVDADENTQQPTKPHAGVVLETMDSAGYTYMQIKEGDKTFWIAVNTTPVHVGDSITFNEQMWVEKFQSKTLDRTFDKVMFASEARTSTSSTHPSSHPQIQKNKLKSTVAVEKAQDGYSVEELFLQRTSLKEKKVKVRAIVTKVSIGIMKRNWVHLEDGTGREGTDDIVFTTTKATPKLGSTVLAEGILRVDKDFGYGYFYPVIVEEATFKE